MLKTFLLLSAAILLGVTPAPAPTHPDGGVGTPQATKPAPTGSISANPNSQAMERAKKLYAVDCAMCHGDKGDGKTDLASTMQLTLDDWTKPKTLATKSDQDLFTIIRNGKDKMPAEAEGRAKDEDVWKLIVYIRSMSNGQPAEAPKPAN
jgi:mono/diheme cytochrome c family protein